MNEYIIYLKGCKSIVMSSDKFPSFKELRLKLKESEIPFSDFITTKLKTEVTEELLPQLKICKEHLMPATIQRTSLDDESIILLKDMFVDAHLYDCTKMREFPELKHNSVMIFNNINETRHDIFQYLLQVVRSKFYKDRNIFMIFVTNTSNNNSPLFSRTIMFDLSK